MVSKCALLLITKHKIAGCRVAMAASPTCPEGDNPIKKLDSPLNGTLQTETTCDESSSPPTQELQTKVQGSPSRTASPRLETDQPGAPEPTSTEILPVSQTSILAQDQENVIKLQADTKVLRLQFQEVRRLRRITTEGVRLITCSKSCQLICRKPFSSLRRTRRIPRILFSVTYQAK